MFSSSIYPEQFRVIRLDLAREQGHSGGSASDHYTLVLPLTGAGKLDPGECRRFADFCVVSRVFEDGGFYRGLVRHDRADGWVFDYGDAVEAREAGVRFANDRFVPGEYVTISRDGAEHTYQVVSIRPC